MIGVFLIVGPTAQSQTADGMTPAEEQVCDPLKADGVTKGLYGLCVAFCEARDFANEDVALTDEEILELYASTSSRKILEAYRRKQK